MPAHDNIHIPRESFPHWIWFVLEATIVMAVAMLVSRQITNSIVDLSPTNQNWVFYGIVGAIFIVWYVIIRAKILKKPIFRNLD